MDIAAAFRVGFCELGVWGRRCGGSCRSCGHTRSGPGDIASVKRTTGAKLVLCDPCSYVMLHTEWFNRVPSRCQSRPTLCVRYAYCLRPYTNHSLSISAGTTDIGRAATASRQQQP
jgi:hypothetical protein